MKNIKSYILIALGVGLLVNLSFWAGLFQATENFLEDRLFSEKKINDRLVIIAIDDQSLEAIGQWPWPRAVYADFFKKMDKVKPEAVGFDVMLAEPSRVGEKDDHQLELALNQISFPIIMPLEIDPPVAPLSKFSKTKNVTLGQVNLTVDPDGLVRKFPTKDSFGFQIALKSGLLPRTISLSKNERVVYASKPGKIPRISFSKVLKESQAGLTGKIVLVGATAADLHDEQQTPVSSGIAMPGVEIQANIVNMFLENYRLKPLPKSLSILWVFGASLLSTILFLIFPRSLKALAANFIFGFVYIVAIILLFEKGVVANFVHTSLSWLLTTGALFSYRYFAGEKERREMKYAFSKYVSTDVLEEILSDPTKIKLGGEEKEVTVFFSDVRGFTTLSEGMTPSELTNFLNRYLSRMTDIALKHRAVVDKYIGDAIMAFWGAPLSNAHHAKDAVLASLEMISALKEFNEENKKAGGVEIDIGIGLNSGQVVVGNMGSDKRFDYTIMGDTVNLASRLEGQTKTYGVHILVSETTYLTVSKNMSASDMPLFRQLDKIKVKGKNLPVTIYQVVDKEKEESVKSILNDFDTAREFYYQGDWSKAILVLKNILERLPDDGPTRVLLDRSIHFQEEPPSGWEGVYEMKSK